MYESVTPIPWMMARVESITSEIIDIVCLFYMKVSTQSPRPEPPGARDQIRVIERDLPVESARKECHAVNQNKNGQQHKVSAGSGNSYDCKWFAGKFLRFVLNLNQLVDAQTNRHRT